MTSDTLPDYLMDCNNSGISKLIDSLGGEEYSRFPRKEI